MKLVVIGLDGLPCKLGADIFEGILPHLGCHRVPTKSLWTPVVWAQLFLGENPEDIGWTQRRAHIELAVSTLPRWYAIVYRLVRRLTSRRFGLRKLLVKLNLLKLNKVPKVNLPSKLYKRTWISKINNKLCVEFPPICENTNEVYRALIVNEVTPPEFKLMIAELLEVTERRFETAREALSENKDVILVYSPLPDIAYHGLCWCRTYGNESFNMCLKLFNDMIEKLKELTTKLISSAVKEGYHVLVASDHGFDLNNCEHDRLGFWGSTINFKECDTLACIGKEIATLINKTSCS